MILKIIGLLIGLAVAAAGGVCLAKEKDDPESRKIYTVVCIVGALVAVGSLLALVL